jgi:formylglycine-generating enzyme required for sulfatase activity
LERRSRTRTGLYDVLGNVWEWCDDRYDLYSSDAAVNPRNAEGSRVMSRGGAAERGARFSRVSGSKWLESSTASPEMGFRVARSVSSE